MSIEIIIGLVETVLIFILLTVYAIRYSLFPLLFAKITGNTMKTDRIRRVQMRKKLGTGKRREHKVLASWFSLIEKSGITVNVPGMTAEKATLLYVFVGLLLIFNTWLYCGTFVMCLSVLMYFALIPKLLGYASNRRRLAAEFLLTDVITEISTNSLQTDDLVVLFGNIYAKFPPVLSKAMMECYVEQSITKDDKSAIEHFKEKYDSFVLSFVLGNLSVCKKEGLDLSKVCKDLQETLASYLQEQSENDLLEKEVKKSIVIHFVLFLVAFFAVGFFLNGPLAIAKADYGWYLLASAVLTFFYGLSMGGKR